MNHTNLIGKKVIVDEREIALMLLDLISRDGVHYANSFLKGILFGVMKKIDKFLDSNIQHKKAINLDIELDILPVLADNIFIGTYYR